MYVKSANLSPNFWKFASRFILNFPVSIVKKDRDRNSSFASRIQKALCEYFRVFRSEYGESLVPR